MQQSENVNKGQLIQEAILNDPELKELRAMRDGLYIKSKVDILVNNEGVTFKFPAETDFAFTSIGELIDFRTKQIMRFYDNNI
jgi:hypothetical protein